MFLHSPSESLMDRDTFVVKEGKNFELDCSTGRPSDILTLKQNGILIKTGIGHTVKKEGFLKHFFTHR